jgi:hypothetical protein
MSDLHELRWDPDRPVLHEVLRAGRWSDEDHGGYVAELARLLPDAPLGGFSVLSDARGHHPGERRQ